MRALDRRYLLLGDRNRLVRDPLDLLRLAFFSRTVVFAVMGRSTAVGLTAETLAVTMPLVLDALPGSGVGVVVLVQPDHSAAAVFYLIAVTMPGLEPAGGEGQMPSASAAFSNWSSRT